MKTTHLLTSTEKDYFIQIRKFITLGNDTDAAIEKADAQYPGINPAVRWELLKVITASA